MTKEIEVISDLTTLSQLMTDIADELERIGRPDKAEELCGAAEIVDSWIKDIND